MHEPLPLPLAMLIVFGSAKLLAEICERFGQTGIVGQILLAAAVIDDVLGLIVLAAVSSVARGHVNVWEIALTASLATAFTVVTGLWGTKAANRLMPHFDSRVKADDAKFHIALVFLFGMGLLAQYTGVAAIVGAFLAGLALSDTADARVRTLTRGVSEMLVPFFLVGIGLHLNLAAFRSRSMMVLALVVLMAAIVTKLIGCGLGAVSLGWQNVLKVGLGMVPRGEVGMVVAQIGLSMAVISSEVYSVVVFMAVATTLVTPLLLKIAFRTPVLEPVQL